MPCYLWILSDSESGRYGIFVAGFPSFSFRPSSMELVSCAFLFLLLENDVLSINTSMVHLDVNSKPITGSLFFCFFLGYLHGI